MQQASPLKLKSPPSAVEPHWEHKLAAHARFRDKESQDPVRASSLASQTNPLIEPTYHNPSLRQTASAATRPVKGKPNAGRVKVSNDPSPQHRKRRLEPTSIADSEEPSKRRSTKAPSVASPNSPTLHNVTFSGPGATAGHGSEQELATEADRPASFKSNGSSGAHPSVKAENSSKNRNVTGGRELETLRTAPEHTSNLPDGKVGVKNMEPEKVMPHSEGGILGDEDFVSLDTGIKAVPKEEAKASETTVVGNVSDGRELQASECQSEASHLDQSGRHPLPVLQDQNQHQNLSHQPILCPLTLRALVSSKDAGIIIGKGGRNVQEVREQSGARVQISEQLPGIMERVLTVQGPVDVVAKAFALVGRRMIEEQYANASSPPSSPINIDHRPVSIRLLIPHGRMGSIIGRGGQKIKEIQELSNARLTASEEMMPASTERSILITGVPDAIHIATFHVGRVLIDRLEKQQNHNTVFYRPQGGGRMAHTSHHHHHHPQQHQGHGSGSNGQQQYQQEPQLYANGQHSAYANASVAAATAHQGAMYCPSGGRPGVSPGSAAAMSPTHDVWSAATIAQSAQLAAATAASYNASPATLNTPTATSIPSHTHHSPQQHEHEPPLQQQNQQQQQMFVPNKMIGAIIGKNGSKINEIRHMSRCQIRIADSVGATGERLVTITGTPENIQVALYLLYTKLETEKNRLASQGIQTSDYIGYVTPATSTGAVGASGTAAGGGSCAAPNAYLQQVTPAQHAQAPSTPQQQEPQQQPQQPQQQRQNEYPAPYL